MFAAAWRLVSLPLVLLALLLAGTPQFPAMQRAIANAFSAADITDPVVSAPAPPTRPASLAVPLAGRKPGATTSDRSTPAARPDDRARRGVLLPLYASFAVLQALDAHSTFRALDAGGVEANPLMAGLADNRAAFVAVKASLAASTIYLVDKLRIKSRTAAIAVMAAINSAYALVVAQNYRLARR